MTSPEAWPAGGLACGEAAAQIAAHPPSLARAARRRLPAVHLGGDAGREDIGDGRLQLVLPAGDHVALALHHRREALARDFGGVVLLHRADLGVHHVGARGTRCRWPRWENARHATSSRAKLIKWERPNGQEDIARSAR